MALSESQMSVLSLVGRSHDLGDGWRQCSDSVWPWVSKEASCVPDLLELDTEGRRVRFTPDGVVVHRWLS